MKVVHINVACGKGSTGVIVVEISELLKKKGYESYIAYGLGQSDYPNSYKIGSHLESKLHALINTRILGEEGSGSVCATKKLVKWLDSITPDIVHLYTFHSNYVNYEILFRYLISRHIRVCWSFFDCWPFTGRCTHFTEKKCRNWETECGKCPHLKNAGNITWFFDKTNKMFKMKKNLIPQFRDLNIIVCSKWLKSEVKKSFLGDKPIHMIYNWIDTAKFSEIHDDSIYEKYGLDKNKKLLLSVGQDWGKFNTRYQDACRLANILPDDYQLAIVGGKEKDLVIQDKIVYIPYVAGTHELSKLYSAALAFTYFSVEDTFGKVIAEAMLCGTPAVVFNATACPEVVGTTGYAVPPHDVEAMLESVKEIERRGSDFYIQRCKDKVIADYGYEKNVNKYISIYEDMLKNSR